MNSATRTAQETIVADYTAGPQNLGPALSPAAHRHEPDPATFTREKDCPDPGDPEAAIRDPARVRADLFESSDYPVLAACAACGAILRADSFLRPFLKAADADAIAGILARPGAGHSGTPVAVRGVVTGNGR